MKAAEEEKPGAVATENDEFAKEGNVTKNNRKSRERQKRLTMQALKNRVEALEAQLKYYKASSGQSHC